MAFFGQVVHKLRGGDDLTPKTKERADIETPVFDFSRKQNKEEKQPYVPQNEWSIGNNCIVCGTESNGYLFCRTHYNKYKNKTLLLKITKCSEIEILDESYEGIYICRDGHVVKSKSEREIDNYLFSNKIAHAYEKALTIDGETFHPDFYLPELKVYIEHWGYDESNYEYTRTKNYKIEKYRKKGITLICTHEKTDTKDIEATLDRKLESYEEGKINFLDE
ncbi:hypothetical protein [Pumilibacter intestinalis]|uniref:hypothetical protein n=1 Tax=Pumilibacter intestinalis TaxID=2941511 RepID=UPI0020402B7E|nr:hypothetical protein [Pumilibacter intestinalis]